MKKRVTRGCCLLLCFALVLGFCACQTGPSRPINIDALFATLLAEVDFATELKNTGEDAALYYPELPQGAQITLYAGSGYYADEAALIVLASEGDMAAAKKAVEEHIAQKRNQFLNYIPEEVSKIDKAVVWQEGKWIIVCITADKVTVDHVLDNAADPSYTVPVTEPTTTEAPTTQPPTTEPPTTEAPTTESPTTQPPTTEPPPTEPVLQSQTGYIHSYGNGVIRVDKMAYEGYGYVESASEKYASVISEAAELLTPEGITVYDLLIPTAIGIMLPDDIVAISSNYVNQGEAIERIFGMMSDKVVKVNCYENLRLHRDEYLYFRTDYHWNGPAAYYAYEVFCRMKGIEPIGMEERPKYEFGNFLGALYFLSTGKDPVIAETPDTVIAYDTKSNVSMYYVDRAGQTIHYPVIQDVSNWNAGSKYNCFAGSDQPIAVFTNHDINDGSACIVVKESYGNVLMSYLADHYQTVYEIDYRYWDGSLVEFAKEHNVTDVIFANNMAMTGNSSQIGMIKRIF